MALRVHFHTDNSAFSGSETTLLLLVERAAGDPSMAATFTYRPSAEYERGLRANLAPEATATPIPLPDPWAIADRLTDGRRRWAHLVGRLAIRAVPSRKLCLAVDVWRLTRLFRRTAPTIVHVNNGGFPGAISCHAAALAARRAGVPVVVYVVNNLAYPYGTPSRWTDWPVDRLVARAVTTFVTGSTAAAEALSDVLRLPPGRVAVLPNAVVEPQATRTAAETRAALDIPAGTSIVLMAARFEPRKGHRHLLAAVRRLADTADVPPFVVLLAGDGPERQAVQAQVAALGLDATVRLLGLRGDVPDLLAAADVVVLASTGLEDFPIVVLEAMAAGRPVVATRVAGVPEQVVDGETGRLVPPGDDAALADALLEVLGDPNLAAAWGAAGRRRYEERFTAEAALDRYVALYERLVQEKVG